LLSAYAWEGLDQYGFGKDMTVFDLAKLACGIASAAAR
jgi:hypothetical protein